MGRVVIIFYLETGNKRWIAAHESPASIWWMVHWDIHSYAAAAQSSRRVRRERLMIRYDTHEGEHLHWSGVLFGTAQVWTGLCPRAGFFLS